jgi:hypothetical protein|tara:strand:+ start:146 stop:442 length:297 start_codon:yes stop_codon:yes gene_type:complete
MKDIKLIRLTSGEEVLANVVNQSGLTLTVTDPVLLIPDKGKIGFMPYMSYCEIDNMVIKKDHIMFNLEPTEDLKGQYKKMVQGENVIQLNENNRKILV